MIYFDAVDEVIRAYAYAYEYAYAYVSECDSALQWFSVSLQMDERRSRRFFDPTPTPMTTLLALLHAQTLDTRWLQHVTERR